MEQGTSYREHVLSDEGGGGDERVPLHCPAATVPEPGRRRARCNDYPTNCIAGKQARATRKKKITTNH